MSKVSIIVPIYNSEDSIGYCINSILKQSYHDIELILVNDGSTDNSLRICQNYERIDSRVKVINIPNGGVSNARNKGLEKASGEFIQFVDSDDVIASQMTEKMIETIETYQKDIAICGYSIITLDGNKVISNNKVNSTKLGEECVLNEETFIEQISYILWHTALLEMPWNKIYRKSIIDEYNLRFPVDISLGEDFLFNIDYFALCNGAIFINEEYYYYMISNEQALTRIYRPNLFEIQIRLMSNMIRMLESKNKWTDKGISCLSNYIVSHFINCLKNLFNPLCKLNESQKKAEIAKMVNNRIIRESLKHMDYMEESFVRVKDYIEFSDINYIYKLCITIFSDIKPEENLIKCRISNPGFINKFFVYCLRLLCKFKKSNTIEQVISSMEKAGIKITCKKILIRL
ncbi:MAG: glycosyltransferase [Herbinix sp.]|nr:glycosyltransferase [Herbinix sp.]